MSSFWSKLNPFSSSISTNLSNFFNNPDSNVYLPDLNQTINFEQGVTMSTQDSRQPLRFARNTRQSKAGIVVDLNVPPPSERNQVDPSTIIASQIAQGGRSGGFVPPAPIDLEALDDEVVISSPTAFAEAKNNSRRNRRRALVVDLESDDRSTLNARNRNKRRRIPPNQPIINCDSYVENDAMLYEMGSALLGLKDRGIRPIVAQPPPPPPPPPEPTFSCPICLGPLREEMTTKCGHIFCKECIQKSISRLNKCPTCRRKVAMKDIIRVYLPTTK